MVVVVVMVVRWGRDRRGDDSGSSSDGRGCNVLYIRTCEGIRCWKNLYHNQF